MLLHAYLHEARAGEVSLFPTEDGGGARFSVEEVVAQGQRLAPVYVALADSLGRAIAAETGLPVRAAAVLARVGGVPLLQFFVDRLERLNRLLAASGSLELAGARAFETLAYIEDFNVLASSSLWFNQQILCTLAAPLGIPVSDTARVADRQAAVARDENFFNHMFARRSLAVRAAGRLRSKVSRWLGTTPAIGMANAYLPLLDAGAYGPGRFADIAWDATYVAPLPDPGLRERTLTAGLRGASGEIAGCLRQAGVETEAQSAVMQALESCFANLFPTSLLEGAAANIGTWERRLARFRGRALVSASVSISTGSAFSVAAARKLDMKIIGGQHGGYQGYTRWQPWMLEGEMAHCDAFVTWGWREAERHPALGGVAIRVLPSPWLHEKKRFWRSLLPSLYDAHRARAHDLLVMPNKVYPFPPAPTGIQATVNEIQAYAGDLLDLVREATDKGVSILHKPHNRVTLGLIESTHQRISKAGGRHYRLAERLDKGMTPELLQSCWAVLWDVPGTGFLECAVSGIPCMVFWTRYCCDETESARGLFDNLEAAGIVHRNPETLFRELACLKADPSAWMCDPARVAAMEKFCASYARADDDWRAQWRAFAGDPIGWCSGNSPIT